MDELAWAQAQHSPDAVRAGLLKYCPNCMRTGTVFLPWVADGHRGQAVCVVWAQPAQNGFGFERDHELMTMDELFDGHRGCAYHR